MCSKYCTNVQFWLTSLIVYLHPTREQPWPHREYNMSFLKCEDERRARRDSHSNNNNVNTIEKKCISFFVSSLDIRNSLIVSSSCKLILKPFGCRLTYWTILNSYVNNSPSLFYRKAGTYCQGAQYFINCPNIIVLNYNVVLCIFRSLNFFCPNATKK